MDPKIVALNRLRGALKQSITKMEQFIMQDKPKETVVLETKLGKVESLRTKLYDLQKQYYELPEKTDLKEADDEIEKIDLR